MGRFDFFGKKDKQDDAKELKDEEVPEEIREEKSVISNKIIGQDSDNTEISERGLQEILSSVAGQDKFQALRDVKPAEFRTEEFEFKKFLLTFEKEGIPFVVKDLQLANLKYGDIALLSDILAFASQLYVNGATNTAKFFFEKVLYFLHLSVSVDGFGRKELSTIRQVSTSELKEEPKKGFQLIR